MLRAVVYPVSTKDIGLPGTEIRDAAMVTFSTEMLFVRDYYIHSVTKPQNFVV